MLSISQGQTTGNIQNDIGVLNIDKLLHESKAAKYVQEMLEKKRLEFQEEMKKQEEYFDKLDKQLVDQQKDLKPEQFAQKRKEFDAQIAVVHQKATQKREQLESVFNQAMSKIQEEIFRLVRLVAIERRYKLIVARNAVLYQTDDLEITDEILSQLDQKLALTDFESLFKND